MKRLDRAHTICAISENLGRFVEALSLHYGDRTALKMLRDRTWQHWSFRDLAQQIQRVASRLELEGIQPGDRVAVMGDNGPEWLLSYLAIATRGAVVVPLDPQLTPDEIERLLAHGEVKAIFASDRLIPMLEQRRPHAPQLRHVWSLGLGDFKAADFPPVSIASRPEDPAAILYTSGTTGSPKGVVLSHANVLSNVAGCTDVLYPKPHDVLFSLLPLHHAYALTCTLVGLALGIPIVFPYSLKPDSVVHVMREAKVTALPAVPLLVDHLARAMLERIDDLAPLKRRIVHALLSLSGLLRPVFGARISRRICAPILEQLGGLRGLIVGGAALNPEPAEFFYRLGVAVIHGYGLTEVSPVVSLTPRSWRPGDGVGLPLKGLSLRIEEPNEDGVGEVWVRGESVMQGYLGDDAATEEALAGGWLRTGDLGAIDSRGYLSLCGRSKNVIVLPSGKNVYPEELELHYQHSDMIEGLCVITGTDPNGSEYPLGIVVPSPKALESVAESERTPEGLRGPIAREIARLSNGRADYKRLKRFEIRLDPLPQTTSRKVRRHEVARMHASR